MNDTTKTAYRKLANNFFRKRISGKITPQKIINALEACAPEYRPGYWRRLRNALELFAIESGYHKAADKIAAVKNPVTEDPLRRSEIKKKQTRIRKIDPADETQLLDYLTQHNERAVFYAVSLVSYLGCRPAELNRLEFLDDLKVSIPSAKKRVDRGLDRTITIDDPSLYRDLKQCHQELFSSPYVDPVRYAQKRLAVITKTLWPSRKARPSLGSWRHQMGSDLKASGKSAAEIAVIMGHLSTESVEAYGDRRTATKGCNHLIPAQQQVRKIKRLEKARHLRSSSPKAAFTLSSIAKDVSKWGPVNEAGL